MTIGEISKATNISEYTLRYYEKKKLVKVEGQLAAIVY